MTRAYVDTGAIYRVCFTRTWELDSRYGARVDTWIQGPYATKAAAKGQATAETHNGSDHRPFTVTAVVEETITDWHEI